MSLRSGGEVSESGSGMGMGRVRKGLRGNGQDGAEVQRHQRHIDAHHASDGVDGEVQRRVHLG